MKEHRAFLVYSEEGAILAERCCNLVETRFSRERDMNVKEDDLYIFTVKCGHKKWNILQNLLYESVDVYTCI